MIAVDASALLAFFLREQGWQELAKHMVMTVTVDHADKEFYNAVWKAVFIRKSLPQEKAVRVLKLYRSYSEKNMIIEPEKMYLDRAFELAIAIGVTVYDALYIALALQRRTPLLTLDEKQRKAAQQLGVEVLP